MSSTGKIKRVISNNASEQGDEKVQKLNANDGMDDNIVKMSPSTMDTKNEDWKISDLPSDQTMGLKNLAIHSPIKSNEMSSIEDKEMMDVSAKKTKNKNKNNNNNTDDNNLISNGCIEESNVNNNQEVKENVKSSGIGMSTTNATVTPTTAVAPSTLPEVNLVKALSSNNCSNASSSLSVNTTSSSPNLNAKEKEETTIVPTMLRRTVSDVSSNSSSETRTTVQSVSGNWGWFEDVHGHDHPGSSDLNTKKDSDETRESNRSSTDSKRSKKKGLLQFNTLEKPLDDYVKSSQQKQMTGAVTAPIYVLEESPSTQKLWKDTAGNRPPQPVEERAFFEKMWAQNFVKSQVIYQMPVEVLTATSPISLSPFADGNFPEDTRGVSNDDPTEYSAFPKKNNDDSGNGNSGQVSEATIVYRMNNNAGYYGPSRSNNLKSLGPHHHHHTLVNKKVLCDEDGELVVVVRGDNVFGTTVSKSFALQGDLPGADTVSISIASYRVVESKKHGKYAQFLVIYCEGSFRDTVGVWKRYSDFDKLSQKVTHGSENCSSVLAGVNPLHTSCDEPDHELLPNAITSWRLLKKRQRWYRCLDAGYLSLKVFLLERFLHDILFESSNPRLLRDFVGIDMRDNKLIY